MSVSPGYLLTMTDAGAYVGGMMVCDHYGIPKDFKYTDPIVPNKIQRIIYGNVLDKYIRNHVLFGALLKEISGNPSFIVVPTLQIDEMEAQANQVFVSIQRTQMNGLGEKGQIMRAKENECLLQGWHSENPYRLVFNDLDPAQQDRTLKDLLSLVRTMDIAEPMERLEKALRAVCLEKNAD
ncbi:MAG: hypothetical protein H6510_00165 [Acidobacteria bacterium]|nr:hypothetical protein [Acidobacteriota bacterium]MCB9396201.1 hypothetical protein [Acidobacteriota bacterium]